MDPLAAEFDLAIIGGGINGVGIARDAVGRGLRVLLVEQRDLASGTSSASTKLIHGGLRYLEHGALRLVREALSEREVLLRLAPHLVRPMRFVLPAPEGLRSPLKLRLGLFLYDHIGGRRLLPASRTLDLTHHPVGVPLRRRYRFGFEFSDCQVDDARLVVLNACDAAERGATIRPRTRCVRAERGEIWRLVLNSRGRREQTTARVLVNATGPWVDRVAETVLRVPGRLRIRLDKGSHIVVPRMFEHDRAYLLQNADGRVMFAIPYERDFTLIGTTDAGFTGDLDTVTASAAEIGYLCEGMNTYFRDLLAPTDVVWSFAGVRPLIDDGASAAKDATRDYVLELDERFREAPLLTVYGGKITTYRRLAEAALGKIAHFFVPRPAWTAGSPLPGGDFAPGAIEAEIATARRRWPFLGAAHAHRLVHAYGTRVERVLGAAARMDDLGPRFGTDLTAAEVDYLIAQEWASNEDDVLWRRTRLGLTMPTEDRERLAAYMASRGRREDR